MKKGINLRFPRTALTRGLFFLFSDAILLSAAFYLAFWFRFEGAIPEKEWQVLWIFLPAILPLKIFWNALFRLYNIEWALVGMPELLRVLKASTVSSLCLTAAVFSLQYYTNALLVPRSVIFLDWLLSFIFIASLRVSKRLYLYDLRARRSDGKKRVLIVGAGMAGEALVREIRRTNNQYFPVGFVDDNPSKKGTYIQDVRVLGTRHDLPEIVKKFMVEEVIIAIPSAPAKEIRDIVSRIRQCGISKIKIVPSINEFLNGNITLNSIRDIRLEDLLGRDQVSVNLEQITDYLRDKVILITGAAGSIGTEIVNQVARFSPRHLVLFDMDETGIFNLERSVRERFPKLSFTCIIGDIRDESKVLAIMEKFHPQVVFHAAAYKHVPLMETNPDEAIKVNVLGTLVLARASCEYGVERFVLISTDKAVNPTSVMGATKRVAEIIVCELNRHNATRFVAVRFGNVLGSRGSVVPLFQEQLRKGGPLTVTHPEMKRYFMTAQESVLLVLQAGALGQGGEVFVLDMGEPIRILDLAREFIRLSGYEPDKDIPIVFMGMRPGEKLFEEVLTAEEGTEATNHSKIFRARITLPIEGDELWDKVGQLIEAAYNNDLNKALSLLRELVPTYQPSPEVIRLALQSKPKPALWIRGNASLPIPYAKQRTYEQGT
ncbi:MAG: nucleoside-diphosphate sugar epimerase/dehydratase [Armatimonadota bacterium]|nr:polysaccharide biosynthesis protein [Armatimonadota bacterium]MDW8143639.1 nucleoside-diphosphate sugar epimerase/dehydratase [Armatimonadota bacterium]